jgi:hypothetical protein
MQKKNTSTNPTTHPRDMVHQIHKNHSEVPSKLRAATPTQLLEPFFYKAEPYGTIPGIPVDEKTQSPDVDKTLIS